MSGAKSKKILRYIGYRMRAQLSDSRAVLGKFIAFDKHLNVVLADAEEHRVVRTKEGGEREEKRALGLTLLRGECVISLAVVGKPPKNESRFKKAAHVPGGAAARGVAAGRGIAAPPQGLAGAPQMRAPPQQAMQMPGAGRGFNPMTGMPSMPMGGPPPGFMPPGGMPLGMPPGALPPGMSLPPGMQMPPGFNPGAPPPGFQPPQ